MTKEKALVKMQFGSHVYGTELPTSDLDYKAVFIPTREDLLLQRATKVSRSRSTGPENARNAPGDVDMEEFSLQGYLKLLCEGQTVAVDMLFVPERFYVGKADPVWQSIKASSSEFISSQSAAFVGYCRQQANKYGVKGSRMAAAKAVLGLLQAFPLRDTLESHWQLIMKFAEGREHVEIVPIWHANQMKAIAHLSVCGRKAPCTLRVDRAIEMYQNLWDRYGERSRLAMNSEGVDWKALMHAVRVLHQAEELLMTGKITFPRPEAVYLLQIRTGQLPYPEVAAFIENGMERMDELTEKSPLRKHPNRALAEFIVAGAYRDQICGP